MLKAITVIVASNSFMEAINLSIITQTVFIVVIRQTIIETGVKVVMNNSIITSLLIIALVANFIVIAEVISFVAIIRTINFIIAIGFASFTGFAIIIKGFSLTIAVALKIIFISSTIIATGFMIATVEFTTVTVVKM